MPGPGRAGAGPVGVTVPPNLIPAGAGQIPPAMLTLVQLAEEQVAVVVAGVDGGAANVADVYPLAPLQEGMFFHHLMAGTDAADTYLQSFVLRAGSRERLEGFIAALGQVIARHDVLRTSLAWQGLPEPVQVVWRRVSVPVAEISLPPGADPVAGLAAAAPARMDLGRAPLPRLTAAPGPGPARRLLLVPMHHLVVDPEGLAMRLAGVPA